MQTSYYFESTAARTAFIGGKIARGLAGVVLIGFFGSDLVWPETLPNIELPTLLNVIVLFAGTSLIIESVKSIDRALDA